MYIIQATGADWQLQSKFKMVKYRHLLEKEKINSHVGIVINLVGIEKPTSSSLSLWIRGTK